MSLDFVCVFIICSQISHVAVVKELHFNSMRLSCSSADTVPSHELTLSYHQAGRHLVVM